MEDLPKENRDRRGKASGKRLDTPCPAQVSGCGEGDAAGTGSSDIVEELPEEN